MQQLNSPSRPLVGAVVTGLLLLLAACGDSRTPAALAGAAPIVSKACATASYAWKGEASGVFREANIDQGEWIYTNGLWQAQGANSDSLHRTDYFAPAPTDDPSHIKRDLYLAMTYDFFGSHRATHNGDYQLPQDSSVWPDGTADLAEVRLAVDAQALHVRFLWNAMPRPDAQIATLAFAKGSATAASWPRGAKLSSAWQRALTVWGTGASLQAADGSETAVPVAVGDHLTEACVPLALLPAGPWTLTGGSGLNAPTNSGQYWAVPTGLATQTLPGSGGPTAATNVWNLLFAADKPWSFDELSQSDQLSAGQIANASVTVDPQGLQRGASQPAALRTGDISRQFASKLFQADGIRRDRTGISPVGPPPGYTPPIPTPDFNVSYYYLGRLQPYAMHVSEAYAKSSAAFPLIVYLHGYTGLPEEPFYNPVGLVQMADEKGYLLASALGRGDYYYRGEGDLDVLEVIADVQKHYRVDPDRIYLMGHSMGGYGSNNVGAHHPDLFAAIAPAEGTDSAALHANLRNLPWFMMTADEDLDTGAKNALAHYASLSADGYDATLLEYRLKIHEYSSIYDTLPRLFAFLGSHTRKLNPAVVSYTRLSSQDRPELGLIYDGAYWLSGMRATDASKAATLTLESGGIAHAAPDPSKATVTDASVDEGGPTGRTLAQLKQTVPATGPLLALSNSLIVTAINTGTARMDMTRAQLSLASVPLSISTNSDGALALQLTSAGTGAATVTVDAGAPSTMTAQGGVLTVAIPAGSHALRLTQVP